MAATGDRPIYSATSSPTPFFSPLDRICVTTDVNASFAVLPENSRRHVLHRLGCPGLPQAICSVAYGTPTEYADVYRHGVRTQVLPLPVSDALDKHAPELPLINNVQQNTRKMKSDGVRFGEHGGQAKSPPLPTGLLKSGLVQHRE
ncbi:uncharacterized protein TNCV_2269061 [Trichonephila clavipes]|nr:uncharacterized protein TNCV_2269061 [Trichonephila clavipes]